MERRQPSLNLLARFLASIVGRCSFHLADVGQLSAGFEVRSRLTEQPERLFLHGPTRSTRQPQSRILASEWQAESLVAFSDSAYFQLFAVRSCCDATTHGVVRSPVSSG